MKALVTRAFSEATDLEILAASVTDKAIAGAGYIRISPPCHPGDRTPGSENRSTALSPAQAMYRTAELRRLLS